MIKYQDVIKNINIQLLDLVTTYLIDNEILQKKDITDHVFDSSSNSVAVNTFLSPIREVQVLLNELNYESFTPEDLIQLGKLPIISYITVDSGNKKFTQDSLNQNGELTLEILDWLESIELPSGWYKYQIDYNLPIPHPFSSNSIYTIIIIRGIYDLQL